MAILNGNTFSDYRINPLTNVEVPESVTGEIQTVIELSPANVGFYGFELNECPQDNGIASVTRNSDSQVFIRSTSAPSTNEYSIDYANQSPVVIFNATENGEAFTVAYNAIGTPMSVKRTLALAAYDRSIHSKIISKNVYDFTPVAVTYLNDGIKQVRNMTVSSSQSIHSNIKNTFGILEVFGNLTVNATFTLTLGKVLLIVHGNIYGSGTISGMTGANGGNGNNNNTDGGGGGGGGGGGLHVVCFGYIDSTIILASGKGGSGGLGSQATATSGANALFTDYGGLGGIGTITAPGNTTGGGGGGGEDDGGAGYGDGSRIPTVGGIGGGGGGGGDGYIGMAGGVKSFWIGGGGSGGNAANNGYNGQTGDFYLFSRYTVDPGGVDVSGLVNANPALSGLPGIATYYNITLMTDFTNYLNKIYNYSTKGVRQNSLTTITNGYNQIGNLLINYGVTSCAYSTGAGSVTTITLPLQYTNSTDYIPQITTAALSTLTRFNVENITATSFDVRLIDSAGSSNLNIYWSTIGNKI